jgi:CDP-diacylglycerol--glycerol-3-phosphate 3-phosphatidyltransferase
MHPNFVDGHRTEIIILVAAEAMIYLVSYLRFRKEVATHAIASKVWSLFLFATLVQVMLTGDSGWIFQVCFWGGLLTRLEILMILLLLKEWTNDVPSILHAVKLRQGKPIKRNKLFNG